MSEATERRRVRVVVHGSVQGVGYRWAARAESVRLEIGGTIRNRFDGRVEAEVEGSAEAVEAMLAWLAEGPRSARVDRVDITDVPARGDTDLRITG